MPWRHLPNALTVARLVLVVPITLAVLDGRYGVALVLVAIAGVSDVVDGFLARWFGWQSRLGGLLDPVADKVLITCVLFALVIVARVPWWLFVAVLGRDLVIAGGALAYRMIIGPFEARPSVLSKLTTLVLLAVMVIALLPWQDAQALARGSHGLVLLALVLVFASGAGYVDEWGRAAARTWRARGGADAES